MAGKRVKHRIDPVNIILEGRKFDWTDKEIKTFKSLWKAYSKHTRNAYTKVKQIGSDMKEDVNDVFLLCLHLSLEGELERES